jgi:hypothetical protein
MYSI